MKKIVTIEGMYYNDKSIEYVDGSGIDEYTEKSYYDNDKKNIHYEYYFRDNRIHREDGPAVIFYYEDGNIESEEYYYNGERIEDIFKIEIMKACK
jgi:hypothetical protein